MPGDRGPLTVAVVPVDDAVARAAGKVAAQLDLPLLVPGIPPERREGVDLLLQVAPEGLSLQLTGRGCPGAVSAAIGGAVMRHRRRGGQNEHLGRAVGAGGRPTLRVLDATAGLGRDATVLADLGCQVRMCERNPLIAALLNDALQRARESDDGWLQRVAGNLSLRASDAMSLRPQEIAGTDTIYLDPMFPPRRKSAAVKKEMQLFQALIPVAEEHGSEALLDWALAQDVARVVVKRPRAERPLGSTVPSHSVPGKSVRFDVYVLRGLGERRATG